ncbi:lipase [Vibrio lentus]
MEMYNHCVLCNPEINWLEIEFRSENDETINKLNVTITNPSTLQTHTMTAYQGHCVFGEIAAGEWVISVETENLITTVEQYSARKSEEESPVKVRAENELGAAHKNQKKYHLVSVGDLWQSPPEDTFLTEHHAAIKSNVRNELNGVRAWHNATFVLEIKALRSYTPMIVDTDEFNLVNSYTFALLSQLAYASDKKSVDRKTETDTAGSIESVVQQLKSRQRPTQSGIQTVQWLLEEVPYSQALDFKYYDDREIHSQGFILSNENIAIIAVRGTENYAFDDSIDDDSKFIISKVANGVEAIINSPVMKDVVQTDLDIALISPPEFEGTQVHRGFYLYSMALRNAIGDKLEQHKNKSFYICGHSLGGAGALLLSALIQDSYQPQTLRLYTYGMPRTGARSFVNRYQSIIHYRHVNNHDLVPQIPTVWANDIFNSGIEWAKKIMMDEEDNYLHHGRLSQLLTYDNAKQVLLTPRQTQIAMLDMAKLAKNDSIALINGLFDASISEHFLDSYIPNLFEQLQALSQGTLSDHHKHAITYLTDKSNEQQRRYLEAENAWAESLSLSYSPVNEAKKTKLRQEAFVSKELLDNYNQVLQELKGIMNDPARFPLYSLLLDNHPLEDDIKEQLQ